MIGVLSSLVMLPFKILAAYLRWLFFMAITFILLGVLSRLAVAWFLDA